ncbi:MAG TPA: T9SS type A sorting domain-containing protein, partial [Ignavibacteriaceae bacterium]
PVKNYMSYYAACRSEFTQCQISLMHDILDNLESDLLISCTPNIFCADITIMGNVEWTDELRELCPHQKIIISKNGSLTLNNTTITVTQVPDPPSIQCTSLLQPNLWDGIYIEGKSIETENNQTEVFGNLFVLNHSLIEFAENGINAPVRFGSIIVANSLIRSCGKIIDARDVWPFSLPEESESSFSYKNNSGSSFPPCGWSLNNPPPTIRITNSTISSDEFELGHARPISQIKVSGSELYINNTDILNNTNLELTAINQAKGKLSIYNGSKVNGFAIGLTKGTDIFSSCFRRGLVVKKSSFLNCNKAIENNSALLLLSDNYIDGSVETNGMCYQSIQKNKFLGSYLKSQSPIESSVFQDNCFENSHVSIEGQNNNTLLYCNYWDSDVAVDIGTVASLPMAWGDVNTSSGNHKNGSSTMYCYYQESTNFPHYVLNIPEEDFDYIGKIEAKFSFSARECLEDPCPTIPPAPDPVWDDPSENLDDLDDQIQGMDDNIAVLESEYTYLTGEAAQKKLETISQLKIQRNAIIGKSLLFLETDDSLSTSNLLSEADTLLPQLSQLNTLWYLHKFSVINSLLEFNNLDDASVFNEVVSWLDEKQDSTILFSLTDLELDTLKEFAESSFGDYTNIVRSFLQSEYDIHVPWADTIEPRSINLSKKESKKTITFQYSIVPNPTTGCFSIESSDGKNAKQPIIITVYNLNGISILKKNLFTFEPICFTDFNAGIYIVKTQFEKSNFIDVQLLVKQ